MKRKGHLYDQMCDKDLIREAIRNAAKGKTRHRRVRAILNDLDGSVDKIYELLITGTFQPTPYICDTVLEGTGRKKREISKPAFWPDQVIHWCIYLTLRPWLFNRIYGLNYGSIPGRGVHSAKRVMEKWVRGDRKGTKYYLKMDVRKFYPSIQPRRVIEKLRHIIKDERFLELNERILCMSPGLPIGMLLSQVYANFFLTDIDFWIKQELHACHYLRYMDDMVIFGPNKKQLHKLRDAISRRLREDGLTMKGNWQVCRTDKEALDFMGFRFYRDRTTLRKRLMLAITRRVRKADRAGEHASRKLACAVVSYLGWIKHSDSHRLYERWIKPYLHIQILKNIIRRNEHENLQKQIHRAARRLGQDLLPRQGVPPHEHHGDHRGGRGPGPRDDVRVRHDRVQQPGVYCPA